jgi:putative endonuclease
MLSKGHAYEQQAERFLSSQGYILRDKNYYTRRGEIDLIMTHKSSLIFIEVRYRNNAAFGTAEETITKAKQDKIIFSAKHYISRHKLWHMNIQFDVITLTPDNHKNTVKLNWLKNAFNAS